MNMWGLKTEFLDVLETGFEEFLKAGGEGEYLLPTIIGGMMETMKARVLKSTDTWYGMTYK